MKVQVWPMFHPASEFHNPRLRATILDDWANPPEVVPHDYIIHKTTKLNLTGLPFASMDTETDNHGGIGQWSVAYRDGEGSLIVAPFVGPKKNVVWGDCPVVFHNYKYDARELRKNGMPIPEKFHDTMIAAYCMGLGKQAPKDDGRHKSGSDMVGGLGLKYLARRILGMEMLHWNDVKDKPELVPEYNAADSVATYLLFEKWLPQLPKHYFDIDMPLLPVLMAMEDRGVLIDPKVLRNFGKELDNRIAEFDETIQHLAFHTVDLQSYIYGTLGIEPWKFTDTGLPSCESEVLEVIDDPVVKQILEYKGLFKEKGTYVDNYINAADDQGRIHPEIKQTSTTTSRLSIARPNLQNVFKKDDRVKLRAMFVAPRGYSYVRADFNQLQFRTLAAVSGDETIIAALNANKKIHQVTADILNIPYDRAKTVNFGAMFGQEAWALSQLLHITISEAKVFLDNYFQRFPKMKLYKDKMTEIAKTNKVVEIPFTGRKRRIDAMYAADWRVRNEGIKEAINLPVQGLEAEVVKIVMNDLHYKHHAPMILQVHDELIFEVLDKDAMDYAYWIRDYIPTVVSFGGVKFIVEVGVGQNWFEAMNNKIK